jgi:hypothetical protein
MDSNKRSPAASQEPSSPDPIISSVTTFKHRDQWSRRLPHIPGLTRTYRDVLRSLSLCAWINKDSRLVIDPTHVELARAAGCSERTAYRVVARAVEIGIIRKARHSDGRVSNSLELLFPDAAAIAKNAEKAQEKTQDIQRPTLPEMLPSKPSNPAYTGQGLKVERKKESNTDRPIPVERSEISLNRVMDGLPESLEEPLKQDAASSLVNTSPSDVPISFSTTITESAPVGAQREDQNKPTESISLERVFNIPADDVFDLGGAARNGDGEAAARPIILPRNKTEERMTLNRYADVPDSGVPNFFEALMWQYRRRDNRPAAREALQRVIAESDDPAQTRCLLMDAVVRLREEPRPDDIVTLAEFIEAGSWRAENLAFNAAQAEAVESADVVPLFRDRRSA